MSNAEGMRKIQHSNARSRSLRRAVGRHALYRFLWGMRLVFGASKTRGNVSRHVAMLRREWSRRNRRGIDYKRVRDLIGSIASPSKHWKKDSWRNVSANAAGVHECLSL